MTRVVGIGLPGQGSPIAILRPGDTLDDVHILVPAGEIPALVSDLVDAHCRATGDYFVDLDPQPHDEPPAARALLIGFALGLLCSALIITVTLACVAASR